jgi:hypothetical protein
MRSTSLFGTLVILGTLGSPVYGLPLQDSSDQAQAQGSQGECPGSWAEDFAELSGSVLPNRPTGARLPKRTDATTTQPSTRARGTYTSLFWRLTVSDRRAAGPSTSRSRP